MEQEEVSVQSHVDIITNSKVLNLQLFVGAHSDLPRLINDVIRVFRASRLFRAEKDPRHIYRSILPFLPPSSPILVHYSKLSDIRVLRVCSQNSSFQRDPPISAITCTALSDDGHRVALGFDHGVVEVVDAELGITISRSELPMTPVWLLFLDKGHKLITETSDGDIYIWDIFTLHPQQFASRIDGSTTVAASLSHDRSMIVRAAQRSAKEWYKNMYIIHITTSSPTIHSLSIPSQIFYFGSRRSSPLQRSIGFSPNDNYVAAFDTQQVFVWSCTSFQLIAHYPIEDPHNWFLNTNRPSTMPPLPNDAIITPFPEHSGSIRSTSCILFNLRTRSANADSSLRIRMHALSLATEAAPVLDSRRRVWFRGREIMIIPDNNWNSIKPAPVFTLPLWDSPSDSSFLTSKDGTRFLLYDKEGCPLLIDISRVISDRRSVLWVPRTVIADEGCISGV